MDEPLRQAAGGEAHSPSERRTWRRERAATQLAPALLAISPHVLTDARGLIWVDARGLPAQEVGDNLFAMAREHGIEDAHVGVARSAIVAQIAAAAPPPPATAGCVKPREEKGAMKRAPVVIVKPGAEPAPVAIVKPGGERAFLAPYPLGVLASAAPIPPSPRLDAALADIGVERCGELAALTMEEVEVRFGAEGVAFWRLSRAQDRRRIFAPRPRALPSASLAWEEYALSDTERLAFVINRLAGAVCAELQSWGEGARGMTLALALTNRTTIERRVRSSRGTANRTIWVRLLRAELERIALPDAVTGLSLRVDAAGEADAPQGDLFDRGLQTARAVEEALTRLLDDGQAAIVGLTTIAHPRPERRANWQARDLTEVLREHGLSGNGTSRVGGPASAAPTLSLQLLPTPRPVAVKTTDRRGHRVPARYRERDMRQRPIEIELLTTAGPDRISGGAEIGEPYARDYFHCVTGQGTLVLLYQDVRARQWYLHGWWD